MNEITEKEPSPPLPRLLGAYLPCSRGVIRMAMKRKREAKLKGIADKLIGEILLESHDVTEAELKTALSLQRAARLAHCPVFKTLSQIELTAVGAHFHEMSIEARQQFIMEGENDPTLYVLASGQAEVFKIGDNNTETHIAYVTPYDTLGEMGYFHQGIRTASARAVYPSCLLCSPYKNLTHYFEHVPRVAYAFMDLIHKRQEEAQKRMEESQTERS